MLLRAGWWYKMVDIGKIVDKSGDNLPKKWKT